MRKLALAALITVISVMTFALAAPASAQECTPPPAQISTSFGTVADVFSSIRPAVGSPSVIYVLTAGDIFEITGPAEASGCHLWYPVQFNGIEGYVTEGQVVDGENVYWVEDAPAGPAYTVAENGVVYYPSTVGTACPGAPVAQLSTDAAVAQVYSSVRADVHSSTILDVMLAGDSATVTAGPFCSFGPYNWYQVNFDGTDGWATEGTGEAYWLVPAASEE
jgi:hypothetical protein